MGGFSQPFKNLLTILLQITDTDLSINGADLSGGVFRNFKGNAGKVKGGVGALRAHSRKLFRQLIGCIKNGKSRIDTIRIGQGHRKLRVIQPDGNDDRLIPFDLFMQRKIDLRAYPARLDGALGYKEKVQIRFMDPAENRRSVVAVVILSVGQILFIHPQVEPPQRELKCELLYDLGVRMAVTDECFVFHTASSCKVIHCFRME